MFHQSIIKKKVMKKYTIQFNANTKKFQERSMQTCGYATAKNKKEAIENVYAESQGKDIDGAYFDNRFLGVSKKALVAVIEN